MKRMFVASVALLALVGLPISAAASPVNLALNPAAVGLPSPLESDPGWGGGSYPWDIVDGLRGYNDTWAHGLALGWDGLAHQATIALAGPSWFDQVILVHDSYHPITPPLLDYWDGGVWNPIAYTRQIGTLTIGTTWGGPSDIYDFSPGTRQQGEVDGAGRCAVLRWLPKPRVALRVRGQSGGGRS